MEHKLFHTRVCSHSWNTCIIYYPPPVTLMYVSTRNGERSLKMKFEPSFNFPGGSKNISQLSSCLLFVSLPFSFPLRRKGNSNTHDACVHFMQCSVGQESLSGTQWSLVGKKMAAGGSAWVRMVSWWWKMGLLHVLRERYCTWTRAEPPGSPCSLHRCTSIIWSLCSTLPQKCTLTWLIFYL